MNVDVPTYASYDKKQDKYLQRIETLPAVVTMAWPNGYPCGIAEMYLLDIAPLLTHREYGGSLRTKAAALSHLVRYCWAKGLNFWELHDSEFRDFVEGLSTEVKQDRPWLRRRNRNTTRKIIDECLAFLSWVQASMFVDRVLIGPRDRNPQIRLIPKKTTGYLGAVTEKLIYPYTPPPDVTDPTGPIPTAIRNMLWEAVLRKSDPTIYSGRFKARYAASFNDELDYLRARRELTLLLLEATGARPGELIRLSLSKNSRCSETNRLKIFTLKRRRGLDPERSVPVSPEVAIKAELFIEKNRRSLLERRSKGKSSPRASDRILLTLGGRPMSESALTKDFQRMVSETKVNQRVCPSMFRHRFITIMIARHLQDFLADGQGRTRGLITDSDYRTILRKVATFTGHAREESLFRYIDWAWEEIGVFREPKPMSVQSTHENAAFTALIDELQLNPRMTAAQVLRKARSILKKLRKKEPLR